MWLQEPVLHRYFYAHTYQDSSTSVVYYLSTFYTRVEIAFRIALFYAGAVIASAFGGLLAYAIFHIQGAALPSWAYLFILEGCLTCLLAIAAYFVLPRDISHAWFFTEEEKKAAEARITNNSLDVRSVRFDWRDALSEFRTVHFYARAIIAVSFGILAQSSANFLALMTVRLGYSTTKTNLVRSPSPCLLLPDETRADECFQVHRCPSRNCRRICRGLWLLI